MVLGNGANGWRDAQVIGGWYTTMVRTRLHLDFWPYRWVSIRTFCYDEAGRLPCIHPVALRPSLHG